MSMHLKYPKGEMAIGLLYARYIGVLHCTHAYCYGPGLMQLFNLIVIFHKLTIKLINLPSLVNFMYWLNLTLT